jgi:hypothetical protein
MAMKIVGADVGRGWQLLDSLLSEENTDVLIEIIVGRLASRLPFWFPSRLAAKVLDALLPGVLLDALRELSQRLDADAKELGV